MGKNLNTLDVKKLTSCGSDWESSEYVILSKIKEWSSELHRNKLFPAIEESIQLNLALEDILHENIECKLWFDDQIQMREINERFAVYEKANQIGRQLDKLLYFIEWALKLNKPVLEEARIIKGFVEENLFINKFSTVEKNYHGKGYFTLPDNRNEILNVYLYEIFWDWSHEDLYQKLQSNLVRSIPMKSIENPLEQIMLSLINNSQDMFEPVVYYMETDLDFPFMDTIYPIAEEKLIKHLTYC